MNIDQTVEAIKASEELHQAKIDSLTAWVRDRPDRPALTDDFYAGFEGAETFYLAAYTDLLERNARLIELLKVAKCPACDGSGQYPEHGPHGEPVGVQCQWCYESSEVLAA